MENNNEKMMVSTNVFTVEQLKNYLNDNNCTPTASDEDLMDVYTNIKNYKDKKITGVENNIALVVNRIEKMDVFTLDEYIHACRLTNRNLSISEFKSIMNVISVLDINNMVLEYELDNEMHRRIFRNLLDVAHGKSEGYKRISKLIQIYLLESSDSAKVVKFIEISTKNSYKYYNNIKNLINKGEK